MLGNLAQTTRRWRFAAVLLIGAVLFCAAVSKDAHALDLGHHGPAHHGIHSGHSHAHGHGHFSAHEDDQESHSHDQPGLDDQATQDNSDGDSSGTTVAGHMHFDLFSQFFFQQARPFEKSRLEPVPISGPKLAWRSHFERPPKRYL